MFCKECKSDYHRGNCTEQPQQATANVEVTKHLYFTLKRCYNVLLHLKDTQVKAIELHKCLLGVGGRWGEVGWWVASAA